LLGIARTDDIRTNTNATFLQNVNVSGSTTTGSVLVGSGVTLSSDGHAFIAGIATVGRQIVGISTNNLVPFLFNNYSDLPSASDYHGQFAHVHVAGKAFYAHAGAWYQLVNVGSELTVGLGTEKYNVGILTATSIKVGSGVTLSSDGDAFVTGVSTATKFVGNLSDAVTSRWDVGANGSSHYAFTGPGGLSAADDPVIYLARGQTYEFNLNASGHPFHIQTSTGAYNASDLYTTGVTNPGAAVGVIKFSVPFSAPNTLYYVCQNHSSMNGKIVIYPDKQNP
jgi:plastocyanin